MEQSAAPVGGGQGPRGDEWETKNTSDLPQMRACCPILGQRKGIQMPKMQNGVRQGFEHMHKHSPQGSELYGLGRFKSESEPPEPAYVTEGAKPQANAGSSRLQSWEPPLTNCFI